MIKNFLFYIEGLDIEKWVPGMTEKEARKTLWDSLDSYDQNNVVQMECIDIKD